VTANNDTHNLQVQDNEAEKLKKNAAPEKACGGCWHGRVCLLVIAFYFIVIHRTFISLVILLF
jgi:hypothetical protein